MSNIIKINDCELKYLNNSHTGSGEPVKVFEWLNNEDQAKYFYIGKEGYIRSSNQNRIVGDLADFNYPPLRSNEEQVNSAIKSFGPIEINGIKYIKNGNKLTPIPPEGESSFTSWKQHLSVGDEVWIKMTVCEHEGKKGLSIKKKPQDETEINLLETDVDAKDWSIKPNE